MFTNQTLTDPINFLDIEQLHYLNAKYFKSYELDIYNNTDN